MLSTDVACFLLRPATKKYTELVSYQVTLGTYDGIFTHENRTAYRPNN